MSSERGSSNPIDDVERRIAAGEFSREEVEQARAYWQEHLRDGVVMPNGERAFISDQDLHHIMSARRILRKPERIARLLRNVFELRTAKKERRMGLSQWIEDGDAVYGFVILDGDGHVRTMHIVDARGLRKKARKGNVLWRQGQ